MHSASGPATITIPGDAARPEGPPIGSRNRERSSSMTMPANDAVQSQPGQGYSARWATHDESPTRQRIKREVYGDEYPAEADPRSFVTLTDLRAIVRDLAVGPGHSYFATK